MYAEASADLRAALHEWADARARANIQALIIAGELEVCVECGAARDCLTKGCKRCHDRRLKIEMRKDPDFRERDRVRQNACRRRRRERLRAAR